MDVEPTTNLDESQIEFLRAVDSPTLINAIELLKTRDRTEGFLSGEIGCLFPDLPVMVGQALTVTMTSTPGSTGSREGYWRMWEMLEASPEPAVLVIQDVGGAPDRCAYFGEVMANIAARLGAVGAVSDSGVRDLEEVRELGFHYFAPYPVVSHGNWEVVDVGREIVLGGQVVRSGDVVHGDANGVVVLSPDLVPKLPAAVEQIRSREREYLEFIRSAEFSLAGFRELRGGS